MLKLCEHFVLGIATELPWDYLEHEIGKGVNDLHGVSKHRNEIETAVRRHMTIVEGIVFTSSEEARKEARLEVLDLLKRNGFPV